MSQFFVQSNGSVPPLPPQVPTSFSTDVHDNTTAGPGSSIPAANVEILSGGQTTQNSNVGIRTDANPNLGNTVVFELTNRLTGQVTTANAVSTNIITFALGAVAGVYSLTGMISAFDITDTAGGSYNVNIAVRTNGAAGFLIGPGAQLVSVLEDASMVGSDIAVSISGNNLLINVVGIAAKTIDWDALFNYRLVT